jgi:hypothetical protein
MVTFRSGSKAIAHFLVGSLLGVVQISAIVALAMLSTILTHGVNI